MTTDQAKRYAADPGKTPRKEKWHPRAKDAPVRAGMSWARLKEEGKERER